MSENITQTVFQKIIFLEAEAKEFLHNNYPVKKIIAMKQLAGYHDVNYYVKFIDSNGQEHECVLKATLYDSFEVLDLQNKVMEFLHLKGLPVPKVYSFYNNQTIVNYQSLSSQSLRIRLLQFIPGKILSDYPVKEELFFSIGKTIAAIDKELQHFNHPFAKQRDFEWDLKNTLRLQNFVSYLEPKQRERVLQVCSDFTAILTPVFSSLRSGVTHNDCHPFNIITDGKKVLAIIDFGDVVYSSHLSSLAITLSHTMMYQKEDPFSVGSFILKGYQSVFPFDHKELQLLPLLMKSRMALLLTLSSYYASLYFDNTYVKAYIQPADNFLKYLLQMSDAEILEKIMVG